MTLEVVVVVDDEVTLNHVLEADLLNVLEVVLKIDTAGLKASHMTNQEVVPSLQLGVVQDQHHRGIKNQCCLYC